MKSGSRARGAGAAFVGGPSAATNGAAPKAAREYLNAQQLSEITPWSVSAIEKMVTRGVLVRGVHYFQSFGHRSQRVFKWSAIVALIENKTSDHQPPTVPLLHRKGPVETAAEGLRGLLDR